jgi:hypothetical protein
VQLWESFETITSRLNLDVSLAEWLNVGVNASFSFQDEGREPSRQRMDIACILPMTSRGDWAKMAMNYREQGRT